MGVGASKVYCAKSLRAALDARPDALAALQDLHARDATLHGATAAALAAQFAAGGERCVVGRSFFGPSFLLGVVFDDPTVETTTPDPYDTRILSRVAAARFVAARARLRAANAALSERCLPSRNGKSSASFRPGWDGYGCARVDQTTPPEMSRHL